MRTILFVLFSCFFLGCVNSSEQPDEMRYTTQFLIRCIPGTSPSQGIGCEEYASCLDKAPLQAKAPQVLVRSFVSNDKLVCQWRNK